MPVPFKMRLRNRTTGEEDKLAGEFADTDWRVLERFVEYRRELDESDYVRANMPLHFSISWSAEAGFSDPLPLPPPQQMREFVHLLRPFILESENTYVPKICGIIGRSVPHPFIRANLKEVLRAFSGKASQSLFMISSDDVVLNSESTLQLWLNAYEYHRDQSKRDRLNALHQSWPLEMSKGLFIEAIWWLSAFIEELAASPTVQAQLRAIIRSPATQLSAAPDGRSAVARFARH